MCSTKVEEELVYKPQSPFSPYQLHYYCSYCSEWILKEKAHRNANGYPICPKCHRPLRLRPKWRKGKRVRGDEGA